MSKTSFFALLLTFGCFCLLTVCCLGRVVGGIHYSSGYREGHVQKFSEKGFIWKTWEGEMAVEGLRTIGHGDNSRITNTFEFTVLLPDIKAQIQDLHASEAVRLHYEQYIMTPPWLGDTQYRIVKVERIEHK